MKATWLPLTWHSAEPGRDQTAWARNKLISYRTITDQRVRSGARGSGNRPLAQHNRLRVLYSVCSSPCTFQLVFSNDVGRTVPRELTELVIKSIACTRSNKKSQLRVRPTTCMHGWLPWAASVGDDRSRSWSSGANPTRGAITGRLKTATHTTFRSLD
jgi:hypothetical protein